MLRNQRYNKLKYPNNMTAALKSQQTLVAVIRSHALDKYTNIVNFCVTVNIFNACVQCNQIWVRVSKWAAWHNQLCLLDEGMPFQAPVPLQTCTWPRSCHDKI